MEKLSSREKSWIMYDWANSAYSLAITSTILPIYFKMLFKNSGGTAVNSTAYWGYASSIGTLIIAVLAPILGTIADYKGYKMKLFNIFFVMGAVFTALLSAVPNNLWLLILIFYVLNSIGFSGSCIFYDAFLVDITREERMDKISSLGFAMGYIGSTIPFVISMVFVILAEFNMIALSVTAACKIAFIITAVWWIIFTLPMLKNVKQLHGIALEMHPIKNSVLRMSRTIKNISNHKNLFVFLLVYFFYIDGVNTIITMATSYGSDLGISSTVLLVILLITQFVAFPFSILFGRLAERYGAKIMLYTGIVVYSIICIYGYFLHSAVGFWILAMMVATCQGGIQAISRSYFGKLVPKDSANEFFGFYNIFGKFSAIFGPLIMGIVTQATGKSNYGVLSIIILFILGGAILSYVREDGYDGEQSLDYR